MSSKTRPTGDTVSRILERLLSEEVQRILLAISFIIVILLASGFVYSLTTSNPISIAFLGGGRIRVFFWRLSIQTHAETLVIFLYYLLGALGLWLYISATARPGNPRTVKYMLFFSALFILISGLGLYNAYVAKNTPP